MTSTRPAAPAVRALLRLILNGPPHLVAPLIAALSLPEHRR